MSTETDENKKANYTLRELHEFLDSIESNKKDAFKITGFKECDYFVEFEYCLDDEKNSELTFSPYQLNARLDATKCSELPKINITEFAIQLDENELLFKVLKKIRYHFSISLRKYDKRYEGVWVDDIELGGRIKNCDITKDVLSNCNITDSELQIRNPCFKLRMIYIKHDNRVVMNPILYNVGEIQHRLLLKVRKYD